MRTSWLKESLGKFGTATSARQSLHPSCATSCKHRLLRSRLYHGLVKIKTRGFWTQIFINHALLFQKIKADKRKHRPHSLEPCKHWDRLTEYVEFNFLLSLSALNDVQELHIESHSETEQSQRLMHEIWAQTSKQQFERGCISFGTKHDEKLKHQLDEFEELWIFLYHSR